MESKKKKNGINEFIYKMEIVTEVGNKLMVTQGERQGRINWEIEINIYTLLLLLLSRFSCVRLCATP